MPSGVTFTRISTSSNSSLAIGSNGRIYGWGYNAYGQLGDGTNSNRKIPFVVPRPAGVTSFTQASIGEADSVAIGDNGRIYAWGRNAFGAFGNGMTTSSFTPVAVNMPSGVTSFTQVSAGSEFVVAIGSNGTTRTTYAWGMNSIGQVGDGTTTHRYFPVLVSAPATAVTSVTFDGVAGTGLTKLTESTWQVAAPARATFGPVEVVVNWTIGSAVQPPITYADGFTYIGPKVEVTTQAYRDAARTIEIPRSGVLTPGMTIYWKYTVKNTGLVPISITQLKRDGQVLTLTTVCPAREIAVSQTVTCTAQSTV